MATKTPGAQLIDTINADEIEHRHVQLIAAIKEYIKNCKAHKRYPCAGLLSDLTGSNAHKAPDAINEMKYTIVDILALLSDPVVAERFKKIKKVNTLSRDHGKHLQRLFQFFDWADNDLCFAEMALYDLENFTVDEIYLKRLEEDYGLA